MWLVAHGVVSMSSSCHIHAPPRQLSASRTPSGTSSLTTLKAIVTELNTLYAAETSHAVFTSYIQQLVDLTVLSDAHRGVEERVCAVFRFASGEEENKVEVVEEMMEDTWSCEVS